MAIQGKKKANPVADGSWGNGSVRERGGRFQVRWSEGGARHSLSGFKSRFEAEEKLREIQRRLQDGKPGIDPEPVTAPVRVVDRSEDKSFAELFEEWTEYRRKFDVRTVDEERARWALHLAKPLETQTVRGLTERWVRELAGELVKPTPGTKAPDGTPKQPVSGPTAQRVLTLLSSFFTWAKKEGHADINPAALALTDKATKRLLRPKSTEVEEKQPLRSWSEVDALYGAIKKQNETVAMWFLLQARCGLRPGEATALLWDDVDLDAEKLTVRGSVRHGKYGPTKGGRLRKVPLTPKLLAALRDWRDKNMFEKLVCPPPRYFREGKVGEHMGTYLADKSIDRAMSAGFAAAKIKPRTAYEAGRVTYATLAGASGAVSAFQLQEWMGHRDIKTTLRYVKPQSGLTAEQLKALGG